MLLALLSAVGTMDEVVDCFRKIQAYSRVKDAVYFQVRSLICREPRRCYAIFY